MSLAESLNWEQEEQYTSVFPRSVTSRKNQENLKLSEKKELLKKIADILAEEKYRRGVPEGCAYKTGGGGKRMRPPPELVLRG